MSPPVSMLPVTSVRGVGPALSRTLARHSIRTVRDLLLHVPLRYQDRRRVAPLASLQDREEVTVLAEVTRVDSRRARRGFIVVEARLRDGSGEALAVWFRQPYVAQSLKAGDRAYFHGRVQLDGKTTIVAPRFEVMADDDPGEDGEGDGFARLVPVYPGAGEIGVARLVRVIEAALDEYGEDLPDVLREKDRSGYRLPTLGEAVRGLHRPRSPEEARRARARLAFDEVYVLQVVLLLLRRGLSRRTRTPRKIPDDSVEAMTRLFPFSLTGGQARAVREILDDLRRSVPLHRLLHGDVGSGKTAVAAAAAMAVVRAGGQVAWMAPTEILARQTREVLSTWWKRHGNLGAVHLLTGSVRGAERRALLAGMAAGEPCVVVGTQALLSPGVEFRDLGLVVVDEQHRFGVRQRLELRADGTPVDLLVMSATPIPRSLALTFFGDLEQSILAERLPGRKPVMTRRVARDRLRDMLGFVRDRVEQGERAYVICPLIEASEASDLKAAEEVARKLRAGALRDVPVGTLHGRLSEEEKAKVFTAFRDGEISVLVSTVVVEVGVDVPEATIMIVVDAHRFGLAQLHQLRGRVGRGDRDSYCFLVSEDEGEDGAARLAVLERCADGFEIAEEDLRLRGVGSLMGERQHGLCDLRLVDPVRDVAFVEKVRGLARARVEEDPRLTDPENRELRERVLEVAAREGLSFLRVG